MHKFVLGVEIMIELILPVKNYHSTLTNNNQLILVFLIPIDGKLILYCRKAG